MDPRSAASLYNRAGDLCARGGDPHCSEAHYTSAIGAYLEAGCYDAAAALCRKLLKSSSELLPVRITLAGLLIGQGHVQDAEEEIRWMLQKAHSAGEGERRDIIRALSAFADAVESGPVGTRIGAALIELGEAKAGNQLLFRLFAERNGMRPPAAADAGARWERLLEVSLPRPRTSEPSRTRSRARRPEVSRKEHGSEVAPIGPPVHLSAEDVRRASMESLPLLAGVEGDR